MKLFSLSILFAFLLLSGCSSDDGGSSSSDNAVPVLTAFSTSVAESAAVDSVVGSITIVDTGSSAITAITLSGTNSTDFSVETNGTITVANALDYETRPSYSLTAVAANAAGNSAPVAVTITVTNVAEIVPILAASSAIVAENTAPTTPIGHVTITSSGDSAITAIALSGIGAEDFSVAIDGEITVVNAPDFETQPSYSLTAVATNAAGNSDPVPVTITVTGVPDIVPTIAPFSVTLNEDAAVGSYVRTIAVLDAGDTAITSYTLTGSVDFNITNEGVVSVAKVLSYAGTPRYDLTATATNTAGESDPVAVTISIVLSSDKVTATVPEAGGAFGTSVAISGEYVVVGAKLEDVNGTDSGAAYVYRNDGNGIYNEVDVLTPSDAQAGDYFGISVAIEGDYIVVGSQLKDNPSPDINNSGAAYVFKRDTGLETFTEVDKLVATDAANEDHFGFSVAIGGSYVAVGADHRASETGAVYIFRRDIGLETFTEADTLAPDGVAAGDNFGWSVAIDGDYVVSGALRADPSGESSAGLAYVYKRDAGLDTFSELDILSAPIVQAEARFGFSIDISGAYVVVGAYQDDTAAGADAGSAYIFVNNADTFNYFTTLNASDAEVGDEFGSSVGIDGDYVIVGASKGDVTGSTDAGAAYIFENSGGTFSEASKLNARDSSAYDYFGISAGISGFNAVVGAPGEDPSDIAEAGSAYLFNFAQ